MDAVEKAKLVASELRDDTGFIIRVTRYSDGTVWVRYTPKGGYGMDITVSGSPPDINKNIFLISCIEIFYNPMLHEETLSDINIARTIVEGLDKP